MSVSLHAVTSDDALTSSHGEFLKIDVGGNLGWEIGDVHGISGISPNTG